ncbi:conserved protein of unknown function [Rhodovastum atsumiense]|uniref:Uncharacterized protein n=1 Tax=Rhodovastum atsumiense TaxID=504468 RepID=A0A5M6INI3_9PROT|nr:hypothetical protein [Rhodovastum atsumiense]KAA5609826.1 hypothetical protein F1189_22310 [Rhodovastum atsumiense]CAH2603733.1 conserved protein of unknown function [Rhodovastum atsumiense]
MIIVWMSAGAAVLMAAAALLLAFIGHRHHTSRFQVIFICVLGAVCSGALAIGCSVGLRITARHDAFMQACPQDHPRHECIALWRADSVGLVIVTSPSRKDPG